LWLNLTRDPQHGAPAEKTLDRGLIALLFCTSVSGLALLALRDTGAMALLLAVHLGFVMALFLTMPYGKFAHGIFRSAALLKWAIERRQPNRLQLGSE
jgi:citrate/tricarballylate utilization protein